MTPAIESDGDSVLRVIEDSKPEILVTCWDTPICIKEWISANPNSVKYICNITGEVSRFVPRNFIENGGLVTNWGSAISDVVAESAIYLTLSALRRSKSVTVLMSKNRSWDVDQLDHQSLVGKKVGIHGFGAVAKALVPMLKSFNTEISAYSEPIPDSDFARLGVRKSNSLEDLFANSEVLVELEALTVKTSGIIGRHLLNLIPDGGVFVNLGRGALVNEDDLVAVAKSRQIQFALDVFHSEPLSSESPLRDLENVFISPHAAGPHRDSAWRCGDFALKNIKKYVSGEPLDSVIDLKRFDQMT